MKQREHWREGLRLDNAAAQALRNARRGEDARSNPKFDRRLRAILLVGVDHYTQEAAAAILEVDPNSITRWVMAYVAKGIDGLRLKKKEGRKPRLTERQMWLLGRWIEQGPEEFGLDTGLWTGPIVRDVIERKFHITFSVEQVRRILNKLGFSLQYPKQVLSEASLAAQKRWLRNELPRIKKKRKRTAGLFSSRTNASSSRAARFSEAGSGEA